MSTILVTCQLSAYLFCIYKKTQQTFSNLVALRYYPLLKAYNPLWKLIYTTGKKKIVPIVRYCMNSQL